MASFPLSSDLVTYCSKIEKETGFTIAIEEYPGLQLQSRYLMVHAEPTGDFTYLKSEKIILVFFDPCCLVDPLLHQRGIAHEITHGLLRYRYSYPSLLAADDVHSQLTSKIGTYLEDIVVNKIILDEGFNSFEPWVMDLFKDEIRLLRRQKYPPYYPKDPFLRKWHMALKISQTWAYMNYPITDKSVTGVLKDLMNITSRNFKSEHVEAEKIIKLLKKYDIFTREGYVFILQSLISKNKLHIELVY